ncbi:hypothetical protein PL246_09480 [Salmonella enterica]|uniref:Uncharacterized protein n=1 Tax=Salmonella enterica subsp. enterica serovar Abeokuta TaxID=2926665 RepID=A0A8T9IEM0_SALET|nr:hypothetical protein [Salmonella enterica]EBS6311420.1 hypothetical protein [Salmonella enterica subsp. enterica serovar Millesi]EBW5579133.1 hypothetical protein [Salmonella enterica subsp. enterica serovar Teddington]ECE0821884.1 hypothetical protein [Salmonella enterica subsp. enterica]EHC3436008.1 hypothetical protein [Salmonella enterica subsp. enterica serovar Ouakam]EBW7631738.1 hypothetical protein [Salmonella enterica subsp. enterica serovar Millesi]
MKSLAVDSNNDIFINAAGSLELAKEIIAVKYSAQQAGQAQLGEMMYATDLGLPTFGVVWNGSPNPAVYEAWLRQALINSPGVHDVKSITVRTADNTLHYSATIVTDYGELAINDGL